MIELQISLPFLVSVSASPPKNNDRITDLTYFFSHGFGFPAKIDDRITDLTSFFRVPCQLPRQKTMIELQVSLSFSSFLSLPAVSDDRIAVNIWLPRQER